MVWDCQFIIPVDLHKQILGPAHSTHPGATQMKCKQRDTYWWLGLGLQVHDLVSACIGCQISEKSTRTVKVPPIEVPKSVDYWTKVGIEVAGPFTNALSHQKFIVTVIDYASKFQPS